MTQQEKEIIKTIDQYIRGELSPGEIEMLWVQFLENPEYFDWFETELHLKNLIRKGERPDFSNQPSASSSTIVPLHKKITTWVAAAAAVVVVVFGLHMLIANLQDSSGGLALASIDLVEMIGADVLRSDEQVGTPQDVAINQALVTAYEGQTDEAIKQFREILSEDVSDLQHATAELNLGILLYNNSDYTGAGTHFETVTQIAELSLFFYEKSWWFLAHTRLNLEQPGGAREALLEVTSLDGTYKNRAQELLEQLAEEN